MKIITHSLFIISSSLIILAIIHQAQSSVAGIDLGDESFKVGLHIHDNNNNNNNRLT